jgi:cathepsin L
MKPIILFIVIFLPFIFSSLSTTDEQLFQSWMQEYGKKYSTHSEYQHRFIIFKSNLAFIDSHNKKNLSFTVGMNQFGDLSSKEFKSLLLNNKMKYTSQSSLRSNFPFTLPAATDDTFDWRTKGVVPDVRDQGQCGSCYAMTAISSMEVACAIKHLKPYSLSEQQVVDCSLDYGNAGCNGGLMDNAFMYLKNCSVVTRISYPYTARQGKCKYACNTSDIDCRVLSYVDLPPGDEVKMTAAIQIGAISAGIDAGHNSFQLYKSGVYYEPQCSSTQLDHSVLIVGYGTLGNNDYYIVQNTWTTTWGLQGYILMSRNKKNNCGIATMPSYPIVD